MEISMFDDLLNGLDCVINGNRETLTQVVVGTDESTWTHKHSHKCGEDENRPYATVTGETSSICFSGFFFFFPVAFSFWIYRAFFYLGGLFYRMCRAFFSTSVGFLPKCTGLFIIK